MLNGTLPVGCGQCLPCRINRQRLWAHRQYLESLSYDANCFVTLTFSNDYLPPSGSLDPEHLRNFLKRVRRRISPIKLRFFGCGEYGDESWRPHYHVNFFGVGPELESIYLDAWGQGNIKVGDFNIKTAMYVAHYATKNMTKDGDWRLDGRHPEFARMSLKPGIGASALPVLSESLHVEWGLTLLAEEGDVPRALKMGRKSLVLGRYLRRRLREEIGMPEKLTEEVKQRWIDEKTEELLALREGAKDRKNAPLALRDLLVEANLGRIWSAEARAKIKASRRV